MTSVTVLKKFDDSSPRDNAFGGHGGEGGVEK